MTENQSAPADAVVSTRVKVGDVVIFQRPDGEWFDGNVLSVWDTGVNVVYLEGYKSRGPERVEWSRIRARVDLTLPRVDLGDVPYKGHFELFSSCEPSALRGIGPTFNPRTDPMNQPNDKTDAPVDAVVHTPGPWRVYTWAEHMPRAGQPSSVGQDDSLGMEADDVCEMLPIDWDDEQAARATEWANARLIAAAPELLAALRSLNEATNPLLDVDPMDLHRARVKAQNAIEAAAKVV